MTDIREETAAPPPVERVRTWRDNLAVEPAEDDLTPEPTQPRGFNPRALVAVALLGAALAVIGLSMLSVADGDSRPVDVARPGTSTVAPLAEAEAEVPEVTVLGTIALPEPTTTTRPPQPVVLAPGELVLTTFYRSVPTEGGPFSLALRVENASSDTEFSVADLTFLMRTGEQETVADEYITDHELVPPGSSAAVTVRFTLPPLDEAPEIIVRSGGDVLARSLLP